MDDYEKMRKQIRDELENRPPIKNEYKYKWKCGKCGGITFSRKPIKGCAYKCRQQ